MIYCYEELSKNMIKKIHDYGYGKLLRNKTIFKQLMQTFVNQDWVKLIDYAKSEPVNKSFVSENYKNTEGDLIYKTKVKGKEIYVYILLEFQSSVDKYMALRMLNYITNFYMDLLDSEENLKELPPVFPLMLYNGNDKWTAPVNISELIKNNDFLGEYGLNFKYFKIIENSYSEKDLLKIKNIVSTLFLAEAHPDSDSLINEMTEIFDKEDDKKAVSLFLNWFRILSENGKIDKEDYDKMEMVYKDKSEVASMFVTAKTKEKERIIKERDFEIAKTLYLEGVDPKTISKATGLSEKQIKKLIQE